MNFFQEKLKVEDLMTRVSNKSYFSPVVPSQKLKPRVSRYSKILRFNHEPRFSSISPVSVKHYKEFSLSAIIDNMPRKNQKRDMHPSPEENSRLSINSSKLNTYSLLPPLKNPTDLSLITLNEYSPRYTESNNHDLRFTMYGSTFNPKKKILPVLQGKNHKKAENPSKDLKKVVFSHIKNEEILHGWERNSSQSSLH